MKLRCPNCQITREIPRVDIHSCNFECSCGFTFVADKESILEEYSEIDFPLPESIGGYPVETMIGLGGMGKVCRGQHKDLHIPVAIKLLRKELTQQKKAREKFLATSQLCAQLDSPHIVKVYDCGVDDNCPYLVMEHLGGGTALELLEKQGPLPPETCARIAMDVCAGLDKASECGLVHRDLKPDNIMFASDGTLRIMDLGLAFLRENAGEGTDKNTVRNALPGQNHYAPTPGTAHYMPPEQILDPASCDTRSDLYALGVTMYQLLTGKLPFDDPDHGKVRAMQVNDLPEPPSRLREDIPPSLEKIILRAMEKNPDLRYENAKNMQADLDAFLHQRVLPSSFRTATVHPPEAPGEPLCDLPYWQKKMVLFVQEKLPPSYREENKELWEYLSTTPQLHLLRLLGELTAIILLAIASAIFWD